MGVYIKSQTKPFKSGFGNKMLGTEDEFTRILGSIWDNRDCLSPIEINLLRKFGTKTTFETIQVTVK